MKKLALAALVVMVACSGVYAQEKPVTLGELFGALDELVKKEGAANRYLEELSIVLGPEGTSSNLVGTLQLTENEGGSTTIAVLSSHQGAACPKPPPNLALLNNLGFYIIQFCDHSTPNKAHGDFHRLAGGSGQLGALIGTQVFICNKASDYWMMSSGARAAFCND